MLDVALLGTGGMVPLPKRWLASLLVRFQGRLLLVDCGEGTQISLQLLGWGFKGISTILLTHMHADHVTGLPGLLLTIGNSGRRDPLLVCGPPELGRMVECVRAIAPELPFLVEWRELAGDEHLDLGGLDLSTLAVEHAIPCLAYSLYLRRGRQFDPDRARALGIPVPLWRRLQTGETVEWEGRLLEPQQVLGRERRGIKLSYVTDTRPTAALPGFVEGADLLICEGMYGSPEDLPKAVGNRHMLSSEAAGIARDGQVRELWLTHFSPSLSNPEEWLKEATQVFPNTRLGHDHLVAFLRFSEERAQDP